ncbi:hypothetical protein [Sandaracinus amylolyticus]|uniref:hypothetical protein n=1 Tax=Sandaracinus amylolyticus TaxID=927083 RepID=UPI001F1B1E26|nr:hypothetical protein [Sandaracinus amylolyticus]
MPRSRPDRERADDLADPMVEPPRREPFPIGLDLAIATQVPLTVGVEANIELPLGLLIRGHLGFMPEPYLGLMNDVVHGIGAYGDEIASLVDRSGSNALVVRVSGGIRPVPGYGFEILAGYTRIGAETRVGIDDFEAAVGQTMRYPGLDEVGIDAELHMLHVELGWSALVWDHLVIRGSIGWAHTLGASTSIVVPDEVRGLAPEMFDDIERDVEDALETYGFTPQLSFAVGYRF